MTRSTKSTGLSRVSLFTVTVLVIVAFLSLPGCGGSSDSGGGGVPDPIAAFFTGSGTASSANLVRITGQANTDTMVTVNVVIAGPTTSDDLYSFAFDLVISNTAVAQYIDGSASFGTALTLGAGQGSSVMATQEGSRVVVGVTKTGGGVGSGNGIASGEPVIVSLNFRINAKGTANLTFEGSPSNPQNPTASPAALDSEGNVIATVTFDTVAAEVGG